MEQHFADVSIDAAIATSRLSSTRTEASVVISRFNFGSAILKLTYHMSRQLLHQISSDAGRSAM